MIIERKLQRELEEMSAREIASLIESEFGLGKTSFRFDLTGRTSTPKKIRKHKSSGHIGAREISPIVFWGGPPGRQRHFKGSLLTWLYDLILYHYATHGEYAEMVDADGELQAT